MQSVNRNVPRNLSNNDFSVIYSDLFYFWLQLLRAAVSMIKQHWCCHLVLPSLRVLLEHSLHQHRTGLQISVWVWGISLALSFVAKSQFNINASKISCAKIWWPSKHQSICACLKGDDQDILPRMPGDAQHLLASLSSYFVLDLQTLLSVVEFCSASRIITVQYLHCCTAPAVPRALQCFCQIDG